MDSLNILSDRAYVLHTRPYRDTSMLVDVFTADHGCFRVVAKGARSKRSSNKGLLQPFSPLIIHWRGQRELVTLREVEPAGPPCQFNTYFTLVGFYLNELLTRLLHPLEAMPGCFQRYEQTLQTMSQVPGDMSALRIFERDLLQALGYGLRLTTTAETEEPVQPDQTYRYEFSSGPVATSENDRGLCLKGNTLLALAKGEFTDETQLQMSKRLLQLALSAILGPKPLRTRQLMREYLQQQAID